MDNSLEYRIIQIYHRLDDRQRSFKTSPRPESRCSYGTPFATVSLQLPFSLPDCVLQFRIEQKSCKKRKRPDFCSKARSRRFVNLCPSIVFVCNCQKRQGFSGAIAAFRFAKAISCAARNADKTAKLLLKCLGTIIYWNC